MNCSHTQSGFSLLEVLCATLILGVALAGMTQAITTALGSNKESELQTTASLFAAGMIESLRAEGYLTDGMTEGDCGEALSLYRWKQSITAAGISGLHDVTVTVENARNGQPIYELRTMLFETPSDATSGSSRKTDGADSRRRTRR